jgi:glycerol kinase
MEPLFKLRRLSNRLDKGARPPGPGGRPMAAAADPGQEVVMVPAFVGLGAPHWDVEARGAVRSHPRHRAERVCTRALERVCF